MADIGSDFDGQLLTDVPTRRLVAEVDDADWGCGADIEIVWLFRDHGGGRMEPVSWPDDWPLDITLAQMLDRGVEVRQR